MRMQDWLSALAADVMVALRQARRSRALTAVALITFALGIGANTAVFSVVRGVLLKPLPFADSDRLAAVWPTRTISAAELLFMQREAKTFQSVAAFSPGWGIAMIGAGEPTQLDAARVSTNFFQTLGVRPMIGRLFAPGESDPGHWNVVILSHALWLRNFGGDSAVIGREVTMDLGPARVVGVMPAGFEAFQAGVDAWLPLEISPSSPFYTGAVAEAFGRLAPGADVRAATTELATLAPRMREAFHYTDDYARGARVIGLHESLVGDARQSLLVLYGAVVVLVVISVVNVGNLLLVHSAGRQREFAIRRALGAGRGRMVRQLLVQSLTLASAGGALGVAAGVFGSRALRAILPTTLPFLASAGTDGRVLAICAAVTIAAGALFGIGPALLAARVDPDGALRSGSAGTSSRTSARARETLVVIEIALAVILVVGAGLMSKSLWRLGRVDLGFDPRHVLTLRLQPASGRLQTIDQTNTYYAEMSQRLAAVPGVERVGAAQHLPLSGYNWLGDLELEQAPIPATAAHPRVVWRSIVGDYFDAMRIPLVRGRAFTPSDTRSAPPVIIINSTMVKRYWPDRNPIGERIRVGNGTNNEWATIVGVVGDVRSRSPDAVAPDEVYRPNTQQGLGSMHFVIRTRGNALAVLTQARAAIRSLDQTVPIAEVRAFDELFAVSTATRRTIAELLAAFAALGMGLGAIGIYGVISHAVGQRTRELGIRSALGAVKGRIAGMVVSEGLQLAGVGVAIGVFAAVVLARFLQPLLFGVVSWDPEVYFGVSAVVVMVAAIAAYVPARRAARIDPLVALRGE